jgi:plastocyanin
MIDRLWNKRGVAVTTALVVAIGCGGGEGGGSDASGGGESTAAASPVDPATVGHASGMVTFTGMAPTMAVIDMSTEATCAAKHSMTPTEETVVVGDGGGIANVFVYVKEGLESLDFPTPSGAVVIDQDGCTYRPHVIGVQAGQEFTLRNSDGLLHNINASPTENRGFNMSQPVIMETNRSFPAAEVMVPVRCDVHGWMSLYIGVVDHPYFAVTGPDGSVSVQGLPPGDYVVEAWHEVYGTITQSITIATGQTAELSFEFNSDMAAAHVPLGEPTDLMHPEGHRTADPQ